MGNIRLPHQHGEGEETALIQAQLGRVEHFQTVAEVFRQLGDATRVRIFWLLCHCEECVVNISAMMEMSSPAVSHHLRPLRNSGLIVSRRDGKEVYYRASNTPQSQLLHQMIEQVMEVICPEQDGPPEHPEEYPSDPFEIARRVHDELLQNIGQRITIEELSKQYLIKTRPAVREYASSFCRIALHGHDHLWVLRCEVQSANSQREKAVDMPDLQHPGQICLSGVQGRPGGCADGSGQPGCPSR